jgi:hypothetical protein
LDEGESLTVGGFLTSPDGGFELVLQPDGNLVEYLVTAHRAVWQSHTFGAREVLKYQLDGNVVLRDAAGRPVWASGTRSSSINLMTVGDDGTINIAGLRDLNKPVVSAGSDVIKQILSPNGRYAATMQNDGNFVVRSVETYKALWSSGTQGHPDAYLEEQTDGNLVIYQATKPIWTTHTASLEPVDFGNQLSVINDGDLVLYHVSGPKMKTVIAWQSQPAPSRLG